MRPVGQVVAGEMLLQDSLNALLLRQLKPPPEADDIVVLRYALVTRGPGDHIFPAFLLDDWGKEIGSLKLYRWIRENGERFPRGEIFGYEQDGRDTQAFLREMELYARLPCYAFAGRDEPVTDGHLLSAILMPQPGITEPRRIKRPDALKAPLKSARVTWWEIPPEHLDIDLARLDTRADAGY